MLPSKIIPMEPVLVKEPPPGPEYVHSIKWDGVRALVYVSSRGVRIHNRRLNDRTATYPELQGIFRMVRAKELVFDGEIIALNKQARPSFGLVMKRDSVRTEKAARKLMHSLPVYYMIFDLLYYKGESIMERPLFERLELLNGVFVEDSISFQIVGVEEDGRSLFERTRSLRLEGVVSKKKDSGYLRGVKSVLWLKAKHFKDMNVVAGGFTTRNGRLNALSIGAYSGEHLIYLGNVSSGLTNHDLVSLDRELRKLEQPRSPFANFSTRSPSYHWGF